MACFWAHQQETTIEIPSVDEIDGVTHYKIRVTIAKISWTVSHRYNDFFELHNHLVVDHGVSKDILPPKKVIGNKEPLFIEVRRKALEKYLQNVLCYLKRTMPKLFTEFLDFQLYEIFSLLQNFAYQICNEAESLPAPPKSYILNPLQLHAISESLKNPFPGYERLDSKYDPCHVLDFCTELNQLNIHGISSLYLQSNILPNDLVFDLSAFKAVHTLKVMELELEHVSSVDTIRNIVENVQVNKSSIKTVSQVLQCDMLHKSNMDATQVWPAMKKLDLRCNNLTSIDETMKLVPNVETLILSQNKISTITDLSFLTKLTYLHISNNLITVCEQLHTKLGNILTLDVSQNNISSLKGFEKLYSLENLDISFNQIVDIQEISHVADLPCLQNFILTGNAVATTVDYRIKALEYFGYHAKSLCLDNERPSQAELDKVQVLTALRIVKEGKIPDLNSPKNIYS